MPENQRSSPIFATDAERVAAAENTILFFLLSSSPAFLLFMWWAVGSFGKSLLFFDSVSEEFYRSRLGLFCGLAAGFLSVLWWLTRQASLRLSGHSKYVATMILMIAFILLANVALTIDPASSLFQLAVKRRAPQLGFESNVLSVQRQLGLIPLDEDFAIGLVGSSQINLGLDSDQLSEQLGRATVIKYCQPGMVPLQYLALADAISERNLDAAVCWVSEFDFFREQRLPTERLRWCSTRQNLQHLVSLMTPNEILSNRAELADLTLAALLPVWAQKGWVQLVADRAWWRFDAEAPTATAAERQIGARLAPAEQNIQNVRRNIRRTPLVDLNFLAFQTFVQILHSRNIQVIVLEGESHPTVMTEYDPAFRLETRERLRRLAADLGFSYLEAAQRPEIATEDWRDGLHLNSSGAAKLTDFLAQRIALQRGER